MVAADKFPGREGDAINGPAGDILDGDSEAHDTNTLSKAGRGFFVSVAGNVKVVTRASTTVTFPVVANVIYPLQITQLFSTGTTATGVWIFAD